MKKAFTIFLIIVIALIILFPKQMSYSGGFTGGGTKFMHCVGIKFSIQSKGPAMPDMVTGSTFCVGIPYK